MAPDGSGSDSEKEDLVGSVTSTSGTGSMSEESSSDMGRPVDPFKVGDTAGLTHSGSRY